MATRTRRALTLVGGAAWLLVAGCGLRWIIRDDGDDWERPYLVFNLALVVGAALSVAVAGWMTRQSGRRRLRTAGLVVSTIGVVASIAAWALPLWMALLGLGFAMVAAASAPRERRAVSILAAGHVVGLAALFAGIAAEVGPQDRWGAHPAAAGIAVVVTAAVTVVALFELTRSFERRSGLALAAPGLE